MATKARCLTHDLWEGLEKQIYGYLDSVTLADVRNRKLTSDFIKFDIRPHV